MLSPRLRPTLLGTQVRRYGLQCHVSLPLEDMFREREVGFEVNLEEVDATLQLFDGRGSDASVDLRR